MSFGATVAATDAKLKADSPKEWGDQWTWLALDSESKMILSYHIGARNAVNAYTFVKDLRETY